LPAKKNVRGGTASRSWIARDAGVTANGGTCADRGERHARRQGEHRGANPVKGGGVTAQGMIQEEDVLAKVHLVATVSDLTAFHQEIEGKLFWDVIRLFMRWANVSTGKPGVSLPEIQSFRKAIALGQVFEWQRTGTRYKLVVARDHVKLRDDDYDKVDHCVFFYADVNFAETAENKKAYKMVVENAKEFDALVEELLQKRGVARELRAYEFRRR